MSKNKKGFTLIELLVVIAIIGILSSIVMSNLSSSRVKAKTAVFKSELSSLQPSLVNECDSGTLVTPVAAGAHSAGVEQVAPSCGTSGVGTFSYRFTPTNSATCTYADVTDVTVSFTGC